MKVSLRPYNGNLHVANSRDEYELLHKKLFKTADVLTCAEAGRMSGGEGKDGTWTYLIYADDASVMAHELSHVIFHVFERCGMDPRDSGGEAFCYLLSQLMKDSGK